jgi:hypothetical protein
MPERTTKLHDRLASVTSHVVLIIKRNLIAIIQIKADLYGSLIAASAAYLVVAKF